MGNRTALGTFECHKGIRTADVDCMGADDIVRMISATYADDFERRDGVWKIARRRVKIHYFNPIPDAQMTAPE